MLARVAAALLLVFAAQGCFYHPSGTPAATETDATASGALTTSSQSSETASTADVPTGTTMVAPPACGDGILHPGEQCDDGNDDDTDACLSTCAHATCGDGFTQAGVEACDDGDVDETDDCLSTCALATCGDGFVHAEVEACDEAAGNDDDLYGGCSTTCQLGPRCGDGVLQAQEECDDGTPDGDDLCNDCVDMPRHYIFVTAEKFTGKLGGTSLADGRCILAAGDADVGVPASDWVAWVSDDTSVAAGGRMDQDYIGWYALPGDPPVLIAKGWAQLSSGKLLNPINRTETGELLEQGEFTWTSTQPDGGVLDLTHHCMGWYSNTNDVTGRIGDPHAKDSQWTDKAAPNLVPCDTPMHIYCIEN